MSGTRTTVRTVCALLGACLMTGSVALAWHGLRASVASQKYHAAKYGDAKGDVDTVLKLGEEAWTRYRWNYHFCILAAEAAHHAAENTTNLQSSAHMKDAERLWCERGLVLNRHKSQLRILKARSLSETSPLDAARYWEAFVDWDYWDPYHHRVLVEFYAAAGEFERAEECLNVIEGLDHAREAEVALREAWERRQDALDRQLRETE